jgi:hypothetical protein
VIDPASSDAVTVRLDGPPAPWVELLVRSLSLSIPLRVEVADGEPGAASFAVGSPGAARTVSVAVPEGTVTVTSPQTGEVSTLPYALPDALFADVPPPHGRRVLIAGGGAERRVRMSLRVIEELRRRRIQFTSLWFGELPGEMSRNAAPDEVFQELRAGELLRLIGSAGLLLECSDGGDPPTILARAAAAAPRSIVAHRGAGLPAWRVVDEWSSDAFAEAVAEALAAGAEPEAVNDRAFRAIVKAVAR